MKQHNTKQTCEILGISRVLLFYKAEARGIKPEQRIVNGRIHNFYTDEQIEGLR